MFLYAAILLIWGGFTLILEEGNATEKSQAISYEVIVTLTDGKELNRLIETETQEISKQLNSKVFFSLTKITNEYKSRELKCDICTDKENPVVLGSIRLSLTNNFPICLTSLTEEITNKCGNSPKFAKFSYITIFPENQGKGYGSIATKIFNALMDKLDVYLTYLSLGSEMPYAGRLYASTGYQFTPNSIKTINSWAEKNHGIKGDPEKAQQKFLEDSTQIRSTPLMIRWKK